MMISRICVFSGAFIAVIALAAIPASAQPVPVSSAEILANPGETRLLTLKATGVQIYTCTAGSDGALTWIFSEPRARLQAGGKNVGTHYAGPTWEHSDGSRIKGRPIARADAPEPRSIPWLKLTGIEGTGNGILAGVSTILRTNTRGGALSGPCTRAGKRRRQPYSSDYVFLARV